jgi:hypothetical protein
MEPELLSRIPEPYSDAVCCCTHLKHVTAGDSQTRRIPPPVHTPGQFWGHVFIGLPPILLPVEPHVLHMVHNKVLYSTTVG